MKKNEFTSKYTKDVLEPIVASSLSIAEVVKKLGLVVSGSMYRWIPAVIDRHGIDRSHFLGIRRNSGAEHAGGPQKLHWSEVLVVNRRGGVKELSNRLRRAMIESGIVEACCECSLESVWNGKPLKLQIEHKNGNPLDNRPHNVCFMCPNCHSQTQTHSVKLSARQQAHAQLAELVDALP